MSRKAAKHYTATVFMQAPAINEVAQLSVVGSVSGTYNECWAQAKAMAQFPAIQFKEMQS